MPRTRVIKLENRIIKFTQSKWEEKVDLERGGREQVGERCRHSGSHLNPGDAEEGELPYGLGKPGLHSEHLIQKQTGEKEGK